MNPVLWLQRFFPRVNARITAPFLIITVVIAGLGVFIVTRLVSSSIDERLNNQLLSSAQAATNAVVEIETEQLAALRALVFTEGMAQAISTADRDRLSDLTTPIVVNNQLGAIVVFDTEQVPVFSQGYDAFSARLIDDVIEPDLRLVGVQRVLDLENDALGDKWVDIVFTPAGYMFYVSAPVLNEADFIVGVVSVGFSANAVLRRLTEQALANLTLYDQNGTILASSLRADPQALVFDNDTLQGILTNIETSSPVRELIVDGTPYRTLYTAFEVRSQPIGLLAASLPTDFVIDQISVSRNIFAVFFGGLFVMVALIGLVVTRSIVSPITQLVDTTRAIRDGDLSRRVGLQLPDEIGELSLSFDSMTDRLVQRNAEVEDLYMQQLEETARREAILSSITDAVIVRGQSGNVVLLNPAAQSLLDSLQADQVSFARFMELQWQPQLLTTPRTFDIGQRHFSVLATPVYMENQRQLGHIIVFRDITAMVEAERLKDEMILQLSHELRTPLTSVRGYVELMQMMGLTAGNPRGQEFVNKTLHEIAVLERMVNQVIDVSAMLASDIELDMEHLNVRDLLCAIIDIFRADMIAKNQRLGVIIPDEPVWIEGDAHHLSEVFEHVLRNAHNYTPENGWMEIALEQRPDWVDIFVVDNGVGISDEEHERVFERMYRGRSADAGATDTRGLGLGLFLSREVIEAHGGHIALKSEPQMGTMITISLPLSQETRL